MRKSIYHRKLSDPKFRKVYKEVAANLAIGEKISELRHKTRMTQSELAKKVKTSRTAIARYENGDYDNYNLTTLKRIAKLNIRKPVIDHSVANSSESTAPLFYAMEVRQALRQNRITGTRPVFP
ncbi:MAG: helix-turn-helix transcriptional regulator [Candidatus Omnitrophica bacterium]|nr:helix-turn-helix transcriptional regulator [Candidatus Omnitrophota bacterium]